MLAEYQSLLSYPGTNSPITFEGETDNNRWINGRLTADGQDQQFDVADGVAYLCPDDLDPWGDEASVKAQFDRVGRKQSEALAENHDSVVNDEARHKIFGPDLQSICQREGVVVETAASQAVGFAPLLFRMKPKIKLIVTDPGRWIMAEWQKLAQKHEWPNAGFVQAATSVLPFRSNSIDALISHNGYAGAQPGGPELAEALRVLKPGGLLFLMDARPDPGAFRKFPREQREQLKAEYPSMGVGYHKLFKGLPIQGAEYIEITRRPFLSPNHPVAKAAADRGVQMDLILCRVTVTKLEQ